VKVIGRRTGVVDPAFVYLPPQYFQKAYQRQRFPVIVALSGYPGSIFNLAQYLRVSQTAGALQKSGRMQPTVMVMIRPTIAPPRDTECVDVPGGPQTETFLARDLPDALKSAYRVGHDAGAWGVMGYSSGGTCALQLAMRDPQVYTTAAALSPDYKVKDDATTGNLFGDGPDRTERINGHDLMWRLKHLPAPEVSVLVAESKHGERGYPQTQAFIKAVRAPMRVASILPEHGSHNFPTWVQEMPPALTWMNQQLTFPQDVVPRHHRKGTVVADSSKPGHDPLRADGPEPPRTATPRR
jgi:enterochelin esterase-like enzyme